MNEYREKLLKEIGLKQHEVHSDSQYWRIISLKKPLSVEFVTEFENSLYWEFVSINKNVSYEVVLKFNDKINWENYLINNQVDFSIMKQFILKTNIQSLEDIQFIHLSDIEKQEIQRLLDFKYTFKEKSSV